MSGFASIRTFTSRRRPLRVKLRQHLMDSHKKTLFFREDCFVAETPARVDIPPYAVYGQLPLRSDGCIPRAILDIGCGTGESVLTVASLLPQTACYGIEVDRMGVAKLLRSLEERKCNNVTVFVGDVLSAPWFSAAPVDALHLFFPDPWPKKRHHKRRIIHPQRMAILLRLLKPGGYLAVCTDWEEYAGWIQDVLEHTPGLQNRYHGFAPRPSWRSITYYEARAQREGRMVRDLLFDYAGTPAT